MRPDRHFTSFNRRRFISNTAFAGAALCSASGAKAEPTDYANLRSDQYLGAVEVLATVKDQKVFTEGPAANRAGDVYFTNVPSSKILKWSPQTKRLTVFRDNSNEANGLYFDMDGSLLACEGGANRVTRTNMKTGAITALADRFDGKPFAKPNDLCVDRAGRIFFTSRSAVSNPEGENPKAVYRIDPNGAVTKLLSEPEIHMPNGIVISPDNTKLYLIEAHPDANRHRDIRAFDLRPDGSLANGRVLIDFYPGRSGDGMCIDSQGNLYVAAGLHKTRGTSETLDTRPGIHVVSPQGRLLAFRQTPEDTITNCTFGGPDLRSLYIACGSKLLRIRTATPGKADYRPEA